MSIEVWNTKTDYIILNTDRHITGRQKGAQNANVSPPSIQIVWTRRYNFRLGMNRPVASLNDVDAEL